MEGECNFSSMSLTSTTERPMSPKSQPAGLVDFHGKRKQMVKIQVLEREISLLQEELKSLEGLHPASRCCKELDNFVGSISDPFTPTPTNETVTNARHFGKWISGCLLHKKMPKGYACCRCRSTNPKCHGCSSCLKTKSPQTCSCVLKILHLPCTCCLVCSSCKCTNADRCSNCVENCCHTSVTKAKYPGDITITPLSSSCSFSVMCFISICSPSCISINPSALSSRFTRYAFVNKRFLITNHMQTLVD